MGCDTFLIRSTEDNYDKETRTSKLTEQVIWEGRGADIGIAATQLLGGALRGEVGLEELTTFAEENEETELMAVIQNQFTQTDYCLDETYYRLEVSY